jgi:hypothetical protein
MGGYQKISKNGKPLIDRDGLPVYNKSVDYRINSIKSILTISMSPDEARWWRISNDTRIIGFRGAATT